MDSMPSEPLVFISPFGKLIDELIPFYKQNFTERITAYTVCANVPDFRRSTIFFIRSYGDGSLILSMFLL